MKRLAGGNLWLWADRLLVVGIVTLAVLLLVAAFSERLGTPRERASGSGEACAGAPVPGERTRPANRAVAVSRGGEWVAYGGTAAARGDRRLAWAEQGVARGEWLQAPAAPGVNMEETDGGYRVTCLLPGVEKGDMDLNLTGDVLSIRSGLGTDKTARIRIRLPGGGKKQISQSVFSNGWMQVSIIQ